MVGLSIENPGGCSCSTVCSGQHISCPVVHRHRVVEGDVETGQVNTRWDPE